MWWSSEIISRCSLSWCTFRAICNAARVFDTFALNRDLRANQIKARSGCVDTNIRLPWKIIEGIGRKPIQRSGIPSSSFAERTASPIRIVPEAHRRTNSGGRNLRSRVVADDVDLCAGGASAHARGRGALLTGDEHRGCVVRRRNEPRRRWRDKRLGCAIMLIDANDIQADFLNAVMREREVVWVFLVNGIKLTGQLMSFEKYVLALQSPTSIQTIFKSAVSTVCESHFIEKPRTRDRPAMPRERQPARGHER